MRRKTTISPVALLLSFATAIALGACSDDPTSPSDSLAGSYEAVEWLITTDTDSWDLLEAGGHVRVELRSDGTTDGEYFLPNGASPGPGRPPTEDGRRVSLAGTWTVEGDLVTFDHPTDTYLKFVDWEVVEPGRLFNVHTNGGYVLSTRLQRSRD